MIETATLEKEINKMKIIAIEGLDKSGKHTQSKLLTEYLRSKGYKVMQSEFHRYDTPTGELIMKWLQGKYDVDQKTIELIMAADKQAQQQWFNELEDNGIDFLILDRYVKSQFVYALANDMPLEWVKNLQRYMRKPNFEIFIDIPAEESMRRKGKHNNGVNDRYESDIKLLNEARALFHRYASGRIVNGLLTVEEVHEKIIEGVESKIL